MIRKTFNIFGEALKQMIIVRFIIFFFVVGCSSVQTNRVITTTQYFAPLAIGVIAVQSFGSSK